MGRRYKRREFLTDAAVVAAISVLLKLCTSAASASELAETVASKE